MGKKENRGGPRVAGPGKTIGRPSNGPSKQFQARLSLKIISKIQEYCLLTGETQKKVIEKALGEYFAKAEKALVHKDQTSIGLF